MGTSIKNKRHSELDIEYRRYKRMQTSAQHMMEFYKHQSWDPYDYPYRSEFERHRKNEIVYYHMCLRDYTKKCKELKRQIDEVQREYTLANK